MDVLLHYPSNRRITRVLGSLALATCMLPALVANAELVFATDDQETTSTVFITDDTPEAPPQAPASVEGSIVFVQDAPSEQVTPADPHATAQFVAPQADPVPAALPQAQGELKYVSDFELEIVLDQPTVQPTTVQPTAQRPTVQQAPLMPLAKLPTAELPIVAQPMEPLPIQQLPVVQPAAAVVPVLAPAERDQPGDIAIAVHAEPIAQSPKQKSPTKLANTPEEKLIAAYQLSLTAKTLTEYTDIAVACGEAVQQKLQGDQRIFAQKLASWALNRRGQQRAENDDADIASADFIAALQYNPRNWRALHNQGVSHAQVGAFAEAFDDFNKVIQINPQYPKAYANRATLYVQAKDLASAIRDYEQAIQCDPKFATAYVGLGRVSHLLGNFNDALQYFTMAINLEPSSPDIICSRGDLQADMGNYGEALADYARTIEIDPEFGHAYRNGAWLLATCPDEDFRDPANSVLGAQQALEHSYGERHIALDTLAAALAANGQFEAAISTVTQAVDMAPADAKFAYLERLQLYQANQPFRTEPVGDVSQVVYEATDK